MTYDPSDNTVSRSKLWTQFQIFSLFPYICSPPVLLPSVLPFTLRSLFSLAFLFLVSITFLPLLPPLLASSVNLYFACLLVSFSLFLLSPTLLSFPFCLFSLPLLLLFFWTQFQYETETGPKVKLDFKTTICLITVYSTCCREIWTHLEKSFNGNYLLSFYSTVQYMDVSRTHTTSVLTDFGPALILMGLALLLLNIPTAVNTSLSLIFLKVTFCLSSQPF